MQLSMLSNNQQAFLALVSAGLWEKEVRLSAFGEIDFSEVYRLAQEQSVKGLVAAGLEHVTDIKLPQEIALKFASDILLLEQRNTDMNNFISVLVEKMRHAGIYIILVKGQGVAQCYERPLWRASGDVDLLLSEDNFNKGKSFMQSISSSAEVENGKHIGYTVDTWIVELQGCLHCGLSSKMDKGIDDVQNSVFYRGDVRSWLDGNTQVFLPDVNCDAVFIFAHFIKHFYKGGIGLRQVCDWCRLLWFYKNSIKKDLLEKRLREMGLLTQWKAFGAFAIEWLGMPADALPFYEKSKKWTKKAKYICEFILEVGNMGHNRDVSFYSSNSLLRRKIGSFRLRIGDLLRHARLFPIDSFRFFPNIVFNGVRSAIKGVG